MGELDTRPKKKLCSYRFDENTQQVLDELSEHFQSNNSAVFRKALSFAHQVTECQKKGGCLVINGKDTTII